MKIISFILFLFLSIQLFGQHDIRIDTFQEPRFSILYFEPIGLNNINISFSNHFGEVSFNSGRITCYSNVTKTSETINCSSMIFEVINDVIDETFFRESKEKIQLEKKILFYEKYFGKLEGDMNDDCVQWIPVVKQPEFDPCIETKN